MKHNHFLRACTALMLSIVMTMSLNMSALAIEAEEDPTVSVTVDGENIELKDAGGSELNPVMIDGSTYLPVRAVAEALGLDVNWDRAAREVQLTASDGGIAANGGTSQNAVMPSVVNLEKGSVMGYNDRGIYTFKGIPYGTAERFKYARPIEKYGTPEAPTGALINGPVSPQTNTRTKYFNYFPAAAFMTPWDSDLFSIEDQCLNLNVWTNSLSMTAGKPVLVFFHGGGMVTGSSIELKTYDGKYMADYGDVVFVSVNIRLNFLGYLDLEALGGDSNIAISDMVLSLQWVRDNIARFGGDPDNVTIMGQSGGGGKVTSLASAPAAQGLFSKVVNASGSAARGRSPEEQAQTAYELADYVRENVPEMKGASNEKVFDFLQTCDYDTMYDLCEGAGCYYYITSGNDYFSSDWYNSETGRLNDIASQYTYMIGSVWAEMGGHNSSDAILNNLPGQAKGNISTAAREAAVREVYGDDYEKAKELFEAAYPGHDIYDLLSLRPIGKTHNYTAYAENSATVYNYFVAYEMPLFGGLTMIHTGDLAYWFHSLDTVPYQNYGDWDNAHKVADAMASALAAFCATGNPSTPDLVWEAHTPDAPRTMVFDTNSVCKDGSYDDALQELVAAHNG